MSHVLIDNLDRSFSSPLYVKWCEHFSCKFLGLMFKSQIPENEGLLFVYKKESVIDSSIHMFFMRFDIFVVWLNSNFEVVDCRKARKWQPYLFPKRPAKYVLELNTCMSDKIKLGTKLLIQYA